MRALLPRVATSRTSTSTSITTVPVPEYLCCYETGVIADWRRIEPSGLGPSGVLAISSITIDKLSIESWHWWRRWWCRCLSYISRLSPPSPKTRPNFEQDKIGGLCVFGLCASHVRSMDSSRRATDGGLLKCGQSSKGVNLSNVRPPPQ